ncbi:hypothetical protein BX286_4090 [Streptomyces sp. 3211.6]|nr:hypothetical protein BX286_4090 [Streptomyces sp. 3211.6]
MRNRPARALPVAAAALAVVAARAGVTPDRVRRRGRHGLGGGNVLRLTACVAGRARTLTPSG